jgi:hypothetical protein
MVFPRPLMYAIRVPSSVPPLTVTSPPEPVAPPAEPSSR